MKQPLGYAFKTGDHGREINVISLRANATGVPRKFFHRAENVPDGWLPVGTVDWVESVMKHRFKPDYFPVFLSAYVQRKIWTTTKWPVGHRMFVKPADRHKRFTGFVTTGTWKGRKRGELLCSEVVKFTNEWRYYVANGRVMFSAWYWGDEINTPEAPLLDIAWPFNYCGAVDFGTFEDGRLALVEANAPFAAGWYGTLAQGEIYVQWLEAGWRYLMDLIADPMRS